MRMISSKNWEKITPDEFEDLCYVYLCHKYPDISIQKTPLVHDGGKDVVMMISHPALSIKIWVECKKHKRSIGLQELGKNVVLIVNKRVQKFVVISANPVTKNAKIELFEFARLSNFKIEFLDGELLENELVKYPDIIQKYFPDLKDLSDQLTNKSQNELQLYCRISEFEDSLSAEDTQGVFHLKRDDTFYIHIFLEN